MNLNRLINMGMRMLMRKGIGMVANRSKRPEDMTPEARARAKAASQTAQKAQRGMRAARRFMK
ncbi:hypothetical protein [Yoonia sp.]|uniref:hypothetical protein n=1 Tax=Yoonia sp. TaxID=2212373 RepID=UPI003976E140